MGDNGEAIIRYAPYLERLHNLLGSIGSTQNPTWTLMHSMNESFHNSPYREYDKIDPDRGLLGVVSGEPTRSYKLDNFPSLWDMFGKFMGGLDLHLLWGDVYEDVTHGPEVANSIAAHSALLKDEIDSRVMPQFLAGIRDINAVQSTTFVIGKAIIYDAHTKNVSEFAANLRIASLDMSYKIWFKHLDWSAQVIGTYNEMYKNYFVIKFDNDTRQMEFEVKHRLWNLGLFEYARAYIGALNGAAATQGRNEPSQAIKSISGTLSGAAMGAQVGGGYGAIAGAALGLAGSFL